MNVRGLNTAAKLVSTAIVPKKIDVVTAFMENNSVFLCGMGRQQQGLRAIIDRYGWKG